VRTAIILSLPWILLFGCPRGSAPEGSSGGAGAEPTQALLAHLPADCDLVLLADLTEASRTWRGLQDKLQKTPLVAKHPELGRLLAEPKAQLEGALATLKAQSGVDLQKDLERAVLGIKLNPEGDPGLVAVVTGTFPADLPGRIFPEATADTLAGKKVWTSESGPSLALLDTRTLLLADPSSFEAALQGGPDARALLDRHPDLLNKPGPGVLARRSFAPAAWLRAEATRPDNPAMVLLAELKSASLEIGSELHARASLHNDAAAGDWEMLFSGWKELMVGGQHLLRAYAFLLLGMRAMLGAQLPPPLGEILNDRAAVLATLDEFLGRGTPEVSATRSGRDLELHASRLAATGNLFVIGILAAVAIPTFIKYIRRSEQAEAEVMLRALLMAEQQYYSENGKYLACGPTPSMTPSAKAVPWPGSECFENLQFEPEGKVRFSYATEVTPAGQIEVIAIGDPAGRGLPIELRLGPGDAQPRVIETVGGPIGIMPP
jgi:hypothetical protein